MNAERHIEGLEIENHLRENEKIRLIGNARAVVIFGRSGVGQSRLGKGLAKRLGASLYDGGRVLRTTTGNTPATIKAMGRPKALDKDIDATQGNLLIQASPEEPVVIVAKRGGHNATIFERENQDARVAKVLVTCERNEAIRRIYDRMLEGIQDDFQEAAEQAARGELNDDEFFEELKRLTLEHERLVKHEPAILREIKDELQEKERKDREQWDTMGSIYRETRGIDIFDPAARIKVPRKDRRGKRVVKIEIPLYDFQISTTKRKKEESINLLVDELVNKGFAEILPPEETPASQSEVEMTPGDIYMIETAFRDQPR
jgi:cytidylate kinase